MTRHNALLVLALLTIGYWRPCGAVDVGEAEESASSCPNVTTVSIPANSTSSNNKEQIRDTSCTSSEVKVRGTTLDLRHRDIAAVVSLPTADIVKLDNNALRAFTASSSISELYMSNNSIPTIDGFKFPTTLTVLDLANNALGDLGAADLPSSLQYLNLSGNPIGSLSNVSFPSSLQHLEIADASIATLGNFSFPSSVTTLNFSGNPVTTIKGVIFPDSLTEFTLIASANSATSTVSVGTPDEARALQATAEDPTEQTISVLEEFEVRQSDADRFEKLTLWDVSTTSTLSCSDANANPRYVQDTMLCVLSDSEFADKYEHVVLAASSGSIGSLWGTEDSSTQEVERIALEETLDQRRSWFLIGATALLSAFTVMLFVNGLCLSLRRSIRGASKSNDSQSTLVKTRSERPNNFWSDNTSMDPDEEVRHLLTSDPQPEPEFDAGAGDLTAKKTISTDPIAHLQQELSHNEIDESLVTRRELLSSIPVSTDESSSAFVYFKALLNHKTVVLKTLSIAGYLENKSGLTELWGFVEEIRLSSTLSHPQIVAFYGFVKMTQLTETDDEGVALVMEYMDKGGLNMFIQEHKRSLQSKHGVISDTKTDDDYDIRSDDEIGPSLDRHDSNKWNWRSPTLYKSKLSIAIEVAQAVHYLHSFSQPLFHGNLSSRKVFLDSDWNVKLGDLTCCSALRRWSSSHKSDMSSLPSTATRSSGRSNCSSQTAGEEIHMDMTVWTAPEVLDGRQYTQKADVYSIGVLLSQLATYECTSAEHSVMDDTEVPMLNNTHKEQPSDGEVPTTIRLLMFRCQAFQPEIRPTAQELIQELRQIEQELNEKTQ